MKFKTATSSELLFYLKKGDGTEFREIYDGYWLKVSPIGCQELGAKEEAALAISLK